MGLLARAAEEPDALMLLLGRMPSFTSILDRVPDLAAAAFGWLSEAAAALPRWAAEGAAEAVA